MRYHYAPIGMAKTKNSEKTKCWQVYGETGSFIICCGNVNSTATLKNSLGVSYKIKHATIYHIAIVFLGIYPQRNKNLMLIPAPALECS